MLCFGVLDMHPGSLHVGRACTCLAFAFTYLSCLYFFGNYVIWWHCYFIVVTNFRDLLNSSFILHIVCDIVIVCLITIFIRAISFTSEIPGKKMYFCTLLLFIVVNRFSAYYLYQMLTLLCIWSVSWNSFPCRISILCFAQYNHSHLTRFFNNASWIDPLSFATMFSW